MPVPKSSPRTLAEWETLGNRALRALLRKARSLPELRKLGPQASKSTQSWQATLRMTGAPAMRRINAKYRGKNRPTDVLSFPAPEIFRQSGLLGELVVCVPVMKAQAKEQGHVANQELRVLLAHGLLHLLGLDHERSAREAARMAMLEQQLLGATAARSLITRAK
jgi:rRNA maturation RNase YbeY